METDKTQYLYILFLLLLRSDLVVKAKAYYPLIKLILMITYSNIALYISIFVLIENCPHGVLFLILPLCSLFDNG